MEKDRLFTEKISNGEDHQKEGIANSVRKRISYLYEGKRTLRDTHVKTHGCVEANLEIFNFDEQSIVDKVKKIARLSEEQTANINLKQGLFAQAKSYRCLLRFANGSTKGQSDKTLDARSMSVKIFDVDGPHLEGSYSESEQDIIVQNSTTFFVRGNKDYHSFFKVVVKPVWRLLFWFLVHPYQAYSLYKTVRLRPQSLMTESYWSGSAYAIGEKLSKSTFDAVKQITYPAAVKYGFFSKTTEMPLKQAKSNFCLRKISENHYQEDLIDRLSQDNAKYCWDFAIQIQTKLSHSIEDVTIEWPEEEAPFFTIGQLSLKSQMVTAGEQFEKGENLRFSPWNGLKVHRPIGELNRLREYIYPIVAKLRKKSI